MFRTLIIIVIAACGASSGNVDATSNHDDSGSGGKMDAPSYYPFNCATGSACTTDDVCCTMPSANTTFGCVALASCAMADRISCDGPSTCGGATPVCCGVDVPDGTGNFPTCGLSSLGTSCTTAAACPTHLGNSCSDTTKVQLCKVSSDCHDATNNKCCTFQSGAASLTFCIDSTTAGLGGGVCHN